jgi:hypothetical protein
MRIGRCDLAKSPVVCGLLSSLARSLVQFSTVHSSALFELASLHSSKRETKI